VNKKHKSADDLPPGSSSYPSIFDWLAAFHLDLLQAVIFNAL
jgi:hypothetical protein